MAGRREKLRRVGIIPEYRGFTPDGLASGDAIDMTVDELEVLRLRDLEGLNQEAVAQQMGIARATVAAICSRAHRKVANALVNGRALVIEGGTIAYSPHHRNDGRMAGKGGRRHEGGNDVRQRQHLYALWP